MPKTNIPRFWFLIPLPIELALERNRILIFALNPKRKMPIIINKTPIINPINGTHILIKLPKSPNNKPIKPKRTTKPNDVKIPRLSALIIKAKIIGF